MRDLASAERPDVFLGHGRAVLQLDPDTEFFTPMRVRHAETLRVGDGGMFEQEFLDLPRVS